MSERRGGGGTRFHRLDLELLKLLEWMEPLSRKRRAPELQSEHSLRIFRNNLHGQSAWDRHQKYVTRYLQVYKRDGEKEARQEQVDSTARNDWDVLKEKHRFLRDEEEGINEANGFEYDIEVARRYYKHLFKEYAIADMKHYKSGNLALRWRSEDDVVDGIGQFSECLFFWEACSKNPKCIKAD